MDHRIACWLGDADLAATDLPRDRSAWRALAAAAAKRGLTGLVLEGIARRGIDVPLEVNDSMRRAALGVASANIHARSELERILHVFNRANLPVMLLKGAALHLTLYDRPDSRPAGDVDLLVHADHTEEAFALLLRCGCRRGVELVRDDFFPRYHYEVELSTASPVPLRIDLHARALRPLRVSRTMPDDALWQDAESVNIGEAEAFVPSPTLMLLHLAAHAAYHGCSRLIWLYDIRRLIDHTGSRLDWSLLVDRARCWRLSHAVRHALAITEEHFGPTVPPRVLAELAAHRTTWQDRLALAQAPRDAATPVRHVLVNLLCTPGVLFRLGYLGAVLRPNRKHLEGIYPFRHAGWVACAHFWRSIRAIRRACWTPGPP